MFGAGSYTSLVRRCLKAFLYCGLILFSQAANSHASAKNLSPQLDAQTQYEMGSRYRLGLGVEANPELALQWFTKAANQGSAKGEYAVAWMLAFSENEPQDYNAALPWLLKASGPHLGTRESGYQDTQRRANSKLKWMCKKGVVEFPDTHPYAQDPKCLLARGNRLFYGRDRLGEALADRKNYHVERDYVASRAFLEKALEGGKKSAATKLAKIHQKGLGTPKNAIKFEYYLNIAGETNDGDTNYFLAKRAKKNMDIETYVSRLKKAATSAHWGATDKLANLYFKGKSVEKDDETAFMYFFLSGERRYFRNVSSRKGGRFPGENADMLAFFQTSTARSTLENAKLRADAFAEKHDFRRFSRDKIQVSHRMALKDLTWIEAGNDVRWFKSKGWGLYLFFFIFIFVYFTFAWSFKYLTLKPSK